jgi:fumarate hydratase class II
MMPLIAHNLLFSVEILSNGVNAFTTKCVRGIKADAARCKALAEATLAMATALNPLIGYAAAAEVSKEAYRSGKTVRQITVEKGILKENEARRILDPHRLTGK